MISPPSYHSCRRRGPPLRARHAARQPPAPAAPEPAPAATAPPPRRRAAVALAPAAREPPRVAASCEPPRVRVARPVPRVAPAREPALARSARGFALARAACGLALAACLPDGPPTGLADARPPAPPPVAPATPALDPPLDAPFVDEFERPELGPSWRPTGPGWQLRGGRLCGEGNRNRGVWLARRVPPDARIEFDAVAETAHGDLKAEFWGDGASGASGPSYRDATSYVAVFGGWNNRRHVLARLDEHAPDRLELAIDPAALGPPRGRVLPGRAYRVRVERADGHTVDWRVDGVAVASLRDPNPLAGPGHDHWGFNNWDDGVCFDNVRVTPLP